MLTLRAVLAGSLLFVTTATAQESTLGLKDPATARVIGIIPGAGHMYAGEVGRGFLYLGGTLVILSAGALAASVDCLEDMNWLAPAESDCPSSTAYTVSLIAASGLWVWSIFDAGRAARRTNARRAPRTSLILEPARLPDALGNDHTAVRLGVRISTW